MQITQEDLMHFAARLDAYVEGAKLLDPNKSLADLKAKYLNYAKQSSRHLEELNQLLCFFTQDIATLLNISTKQLQQAESFWSWQSSSTRKASLLKPQSVLIDGFQINIGEEFIDLPLTEAQKKALLSIFDATPPLWFSSKEKWLQELLKADIRQSLGLGLDAPMDYEDLKNHHAWNIYAKRTIPATLKWLPIVGASQHQLRIRKPDGSTHDFPAYRVSIPLPYEAPDTSHQALTKLNIEQITLGLGKVSNERDMLLVSLLTGHQTEGYLISLLLSAYRFFKGKPHQEDNGYMVDIEDKAIPQDGSIKHYNIGVNGYRSNTPVAIPAPYCATLDEFNPFRQGIEKHNQIISELNWIDTHCRAFTFDRNPNLFAAALMDAAERYEQGISLGHCKSSKDRKGYELLLADTILVYQALYQAVPMYNDQGEKRQKFLNIAVKLFETGVYSDIAAFHSPGSFGLKDEGFVPSDLKKALGDSYQASKLKAAWNKPGPNKYFKLSEFLTREYVAIPVLVVGPKLVITALVMANPCASLLMIGLSLMVMELLAYCHQYQHQQVHQNILSANISLAQ